MLSHQIGINTIKPLTGAKIKAIMSQFGLKQLIREPKHILSNTYSCTDLVFTSQLNLVMESGVSSSYNCHHQLVYANFNLKVWYPPPYKREIWHYQHANIDLSKEQLKSFLGESHLEIFALMK